MFMEYTPTPTYAFTVQAAHIRTIPSRERESRLIAVSDIGASPRSPSADSGASWDQAIRVGGDE